MCDGFGMVKSVSYGMATLDSCGSKENRNMQPNNNKIMLWISICRLVMNSIILIGSCVLLSLEPMSNTGLIVGISIAILIILVGSRVDIMDLLGKWYVIPGKKWFSWMNLWNLFPFGLILWMATMKPQGSVESYSTYFLSFTYLLFVFEPRNEYVLITDRFIKYSGVEGRIDFLDYIKIKWRDVTKIEYVENGIRISSEKKIIEICYTDVHPRYLPLLKERLNRMPRPELTIKKPIFEDAGA